MGLLRRRAVLVAAAAVLVAAAAGLGVALAVNGGGGHATSTAFTGATCDSYGKPWVKWFNKNAKAEGNPTRMLSACCQNATVKGHKVHHCFIKVTLVGTTVAGCATYDLGSNGLPVDPSVSMGQHQNCPLPRPSQDT